MAKIKINKLPKGFKLDNGKIVEDKFMRDGGDLRTGDQANYGLVTTPQEYYSNTNFNNTDDKSVRYSLSSVPRDNANIEAEGGETVLTDLTNDGTFGLYDIRGPRHNAGGVPMFLPEQSFIYSDTNKMKFTKDELADFGINTKKKMTPAKLSKKYELNDYYAHLQSPYADTIQSTTAELMLKKNMMNLSKVAFVQESKKKFEDGVPLAAHPYLVQQGIDPIEFTAKMEKITMQEAQMKAMAGMPPEQLEQMMMLQEMMAQMQQQGQSPEGQMQQGQQPMNQEMAMQEQAMAKFGGERRLKKYQNAGQPGSTKPDFESIVRENVEIENEQELNELIAIVETAYNNRATVVGKKIAANELLSANLTDFVDNNPTPETFTTGVNAEESYIPSYNDNVDPSLFEAYQSGVDPNLNYYDKKSSTITLDNGNTQTTSMNYSNYRSPDDRNRNLSFGLDDDDKSGEMDMNKTVQEEFDKQGRQIKQVVTVGGTVFSDSTTEYKNNGNNVTTLQDYSGGMDGMPSSKRVITRNDKGKHYIHTDKNGKFIEEYNTVITGDSKVEVFNDESGKIINIFNITDEGWDEVAPPANTSSDEYVENLKSQNTSTTEASSNQNNTTNTEQESSSSNTTQSNTTQSNTASSNTTPSDNIAFDQNMQDRYTNDWGIKFNDVGIGATTYPDDQPYKGKGLFYNAGDNIGGFKEAYSNLYPGYDALIASLPKYGKKKNPEVEKFQEWFSNIHIPEQVAKMKAEREAAGLEFTDENVNDAITALRKDYAPKVDGFMGVETSSRRPFTYTLPDSEEEGVSEELDVSEEPNVLPVVDIPEEYFPPAPEFWQQDINNLNALALTKDNLYLPFQPDAERITLSPTFDDWRSRVNSNNASASTLAQALGAAGGPQAVANSNLAGQAMNENAKAINRVNTNNVGIANQFEGMQGQYDMAINAENAKRQTAVYDGTQAALQDSDNFDNWKITQQALLQNAALDNRAFADAENKNQSYMNIVPSSGGLIRQVGSRPHEKEKPVDKSEQWFNRVAEFQRNSGDKEFNKEMWESYNNYVYGSESSKNKNYNPQRPAKKGKEIKRMVVPFYTGKMGR